MNAQSPFPPPLHIPTLMRQYGLRPSKGLGQNFLQDENTLRKITAAAEASMQDTVLEIGPGLGSLTRHLALAARQVVAVELDHSLFPVLQAVLAPYTNVRLIHADILELSPAQAGLPEGYLAVANIPYYITSALFRHLLEGTPRPRRLVLTVQREVAERICAVPGKLSLLALSVQVYGKPAIATHIPGGAFYPRSRVDSAVIRLELYPQPAIPQAQLETFFKLARAGFNQRRKTLRNSLSPLAPREQVQSVLQLAGIDAGRRAETLNLAEWGKLSERWNEMEKQGG